MSNTIKIYDTTLRDGAQAEGVSFSKIDKVRIARMLDSFGVSYIEGGWPGSNPKDMGFFEDVRGLTFEHAKIAAFGSTRRATNSVEDDYNIKLLLQAESPAVTIVGKSSLLHVNYVLRVDPDVNLTLIGDSCQYLRDQGREVIYDAEHFFDGYEENADYTMSTILAAANSGAHCIVLCDTNGGSLPSRVTQIVTEVRRRLPEGVEVGIHTHNDSGCGVANSIAAIESGAVHIQGTINGIGERCGNADLCSVIPNLELKMGRRCLPDGRLALLKETSDFVTDLANMQPNIRLPYVGATAFAHKGGIHVDAVKKVSKSYEHIEPEQVGNRRRVLVSDLSGGASVLMKAEEHNIKLEAKSPEVKAILAELKKLENQGYEFEAAGASFRVLMQKILETHTPFFKLDGYRVIVEKRGHDEPCLSEATVKVIVNGETELSAAEGDGPVNALDQALRKALMRFYPQVADVQLRDFKVRIVEGETGTAARTRVLIESSDGKRNWGTVGVSENIIEASWEALVDSVEYALYEGAKDH